MTVRMSGGRSGISPVTLIVFILLFIVGLTISAVMYLKKFPVEMELVRVQGQIKDRDVLVSRVLDETALVRSYLAPERKDPEAVLQFYKDIDLTGIEVEPKNFKTLNVSLDLWVLRLQGAIEDLSLSIGEATAAADGDEVAREATKDDYSRRVQDKNAELQKLTTFLTDELQKKEALVAQYAREKQEFINKYNNARDEWEARKAKLLRSASDLTFKNVGIRRDLKVLRPEHTIEPPAGHVVQSDWRTRKAVVNIGERQHVFPGLLFEVYFFDGHGERVVKGKLEVLSVQDVTSVCNMIEGDPRNPIVPGDSIQTRLVPIQPHQRFVIAGFIPPDAPYDEDKLKALIKLNGGEVQDAVGLYTDVLILGETAPRGIGELEKKDLDKLQDRLRTGLQEAEVAKELSIDVVDYMDFIQSLQQ